MRSIPCGFISDFSVVNNSVEKKHTALIRITLVYELLLSVLQHPMFGIFLRWFILLWQTSATPRTVWSIWLLLETICSPTTNKQTQQTHKSKLSSVNCVRPVCFSNLGTHILRISIFLSRPVHVEISRIPWQRFQGGLWRLYANQIRQRSPNRKHRYTWAHQDQHVALGWSWARAHSKRRSLKTWRMNTELLSTNWLGWIKALMGLSAPMHVVCLPDRAAYPWRAGSWAGTIGKLARIWCWWVSAQNGPSDHWVKLATAGRWSHRPSLHHPWNSQNGLPYFLFTMFQNSYFS